MNSAWLGLGAVMFGAGGAAAAPPATLAYYESNSQRALRAERHIVSEVAADLYAVDITGHVSGSLPRALKAVAHASGIRVFATISNFGAHGFSETIGHAVLTDGAARARALAGMKSLAADPAVAGINIDFENINKKDRQAYAAFVAAAARLLHAAGSLEVVSVPAALSDDPHDSWTGAFDYAAIGRVCDVFQLMTYDENGPWGPPGPVAGFDWVSRSVAYTLTAMPAARISLGMPAYGYDWNLTRKTGAQIAEAAVPALIARTGAATHWDAPSRSPWLTYTAADGSSHVVWYEDARSARIKAAIVPGNGLMGVSVYALGLDDPAYWTAIGQGLSAR